MLNNLLLRTPAATVLLGTLYPLFLDVVAGHKVSVGPPFFNATFVPLMVPLLVAMAVGPMLAWKRGDLAAALRRSEWRCSRTAARRLSAGRCMMRAACSGCSGSASPDGCSSAR